jgi:hypothetical protein
MVLVDLGCLVHWVCDHLLSGIVQVFFPNGTLKEPMVVLALVLPAAFPGCLCEKPRCSTSQSTIS